MKKSLCFLASAAVASIAWADTISPASFSATIDVGGSTSLTKTVTVTPEVTTAKVDVFFLVDTTGSMGSEITAVKNAISTIFTNTSAFGDIAYGVGHYEDYPTSGWGGTGDVPWEMLQDITTDNSLVTAGINALDLGWGNDGPEANFTGLKSMADEASWRAGSKRIAFWFGDAQSHDPADTTGYPGPTIDDTIASLVGKNIQVEALDSGSLDSQGEATAITTATGGSLQSFYGADLAALAQIVQDALTTSFATYSTVSIDLSEVPVGLTAVSTPGSYVGSYTRDATETFTFDLTFTGDVAGTYDFDIYGLVDGVRTTLAEKDHIVVTGDPSIPEPSMAAFAGIALLLGFIGIRRRR